ncbi:Beta-galactosidase 5 [Zea mays]|uniref:Beta-galactosidase 5 n=1 Tax=Zea mays TaxID=4577 RepID=A0A1D6PQ25_MAIZE|nr:Beta-galactosidase 5 [Zea mays]AQK48894.1 Beta-galactosidase 5 [Zea mays]
MQEAHVFQSPSGCAAFLANYNSNSYANVVFNNEQYSLPHWSISILPDCKNVVFNSVTVGVQTSQMQMCGDDASSMTWKRYDEEVYSLAAAPLLTTTSLLEQLNVTRDNSDYLWYITSVDISSSENFLQGGGKPLSLSVQSAGHALHVFVNGQLQGSAYGTRED